MNELRKKDPDVWELLPRIDGMLDVLKRATESDTFELKAESVYWLCDALQDDIAAVHEKLQGTHDRTVCLLTEIRDTLDKIRLDEDPDVEENTEALMVAEELLGQIPLIG